MPRIGNTLLSSFHSPINPNNIAKGPKINPSKNIPPTIPISPNIIDNIPNIFPIIFHLNFLELIIIYRELLLNLAYLFIRKII